MTEEYKWNYISGCFENGDVELMEVSTPNQHYWFDDVPIKVLGVGSKISKTEDYTNPNLKSGFSKSWFAFIFFLGVSLILAVFIGWVIYSL